MVGASESSLLRNHEHSSRGFEYVREMLEDRHLARQKTKRLAVWLKVLVRIEVVRMAEGAHSPCPWLENSGWSWYFLRRCGIEDGLQGVYPGWYLGSLLQEGGPVVWESHCGRSGMVSKAN